MYVICDVTWLHDVLKANSRRRLSTFVVCLLLSIATLTVLFHSVEFTINPEARFLKQIPQRITSLRHCNPVVGGKKPPTAEQRTPPWQALLNNTETNFSRLYIQAFAPQNKRLGNQLFNYASLYGIAWRNNRIPLWPDGNTQLRTAFHIRIPIDRKNVIINVSTSTF